MGHLGKPGDVFKLREVYKDVSAQWVASLDPEARGLEG